MIRSLVLIAAAGAAAAYFYRQSQKSRAHAAAAALPEDLRIEEAVRRKLAEVVADPAGIHVTVSHGKALLRGPVLPGERDRALAAVLDVPGVLQVTNLLEPVEPARPLAT
jgi:osmotically-inducible protein OsmY